MTSNTKHQTPNIKHRISGQAFVHDYPPQPKEFLASYVRLMPGQTAEGLAGLETVFNQFNPEYPFDYPFRDQAVPVSCFAVHEWLARFAYHMEIGIGLFVLAGIAAVAIAWLTVSYQSIKTAQADPVKSLRYE